MKELEVHVGVICFYKDKALVIKRSPDKRLYPSKWECGGGKIEPGESFLEACKREIKEELGLEIEYVATLGVYEIPLENDYKIPGVKFVFKIISDKEPKLSKEHTEWKYISKDEIGDIDLIDGIDDELEEAFEIMQL